MEGAGEQLPLTGSAGPARRPRRRRAGSEPAEVLPVARVAVDVSLPHLDRTFDYLVPRRLAEAAVPGCRVRVRFAGRLLGAFCLDRRDSSAHSGRLAPLAGVVSPEPVLHPEVIGLCRAVADRYAGGLADVLRLAVPPRHARTEAEESPSALPPPPQPNPGAWNRYVDGAAFLAALGRGGAPRAVWTALPGGGWFAAVAQAVQATLAAGRGAVVVVPDVRDLDLLDAALTETLGSGRHVALRADSGPSVRYRRWLAVHRGAVRAVIGTRAAVFAPVADLGLVAIWDDGDDLHAEPRAPYPHVRDVGVLRAHLAGAGALVGGHSRSVEGASLLAAGWARPLVAARAVVRTVAPRVDAAGDDLALATDAAARTARLPSMAWQVARAALHEGAPVLVQVPRRGYVPAVACSACRGPARCPSCAGPLGRAGSGTVACRWCGRSVPDWTCGACGGRGLRALVTGSERTAEEIGRSFPGVGVHTSVGGRVLARLPARPALVVATPGAEPPADGGYGAVLLLDGWALLTRADLRAGEETLRRWLGAAALARPRDQGGRVAVLADAGVPAVQALIRWDPDSFAARELDERTELRFPPAVRMAALDGGPAAIAQFLDAAQLPAAAEVLGPVPGRTEGEERTLIRVPRRDGVALAAALKAAAGVRSARKGAESVRVRLDPTELL